ncbi:hypothetical protein [Kutzneria buriramensis]|uniref:Uncharacterized protein n=1 Tax=Kutzneria buriramensis TaxID=1045776 RepID=A0A3E0HQK1_9PSEU|nr:hypothetical protein [Kutzneria buriramensis]REH48689.1 hypothetical protein BCF44_105548 [Kutzneria buriramensis]
MRILVALLVAAGVIGGAAWLLTPRGGTAQTDKEARSIATAISYPRSPDAMGYARTLLAKYPNVKVLEATDLKAVQPTDPLTHLVIRIDYDKCGGNVIACQPIPATVCYGFDLNRYEPINGPSVVDCPSNTPIIPPAVAKNDIPSGTSEALRAVLGGLPASPGDAQVKAALDAGLPKPAVDPGTGLAGVAPQVTVAVHGADVGVAIRGGDYFGGYQCTFGLRQGGKVWVWAPGHAQMQPGELVCEAGEAFSAYAQTPPH